MPKSFRLPKVSPLQLKFCDFALVRTPLLPIRIFTDMPNRIVEDSMQDANGRRSACRQYLGALIRDPIVSEAIYVGSPSLFERMRRWDPLSTGSQQIKLQHALLNYVSRMSYRCTPFGLFAGVSPALRISTSRQDIRAAPGIRLVPTSRYKRFSRLDMSVISNIVAQSLADPSIRRTLKYRHNPTIYRRGRHWLFFRNHSVVSSLKHCELFRMSSSAHIDALAAQLSTAPHGIPYSDLIDILSREMDSGRAEGAHTLIDLLISERFLLSNLEPSMTGGDPLHHILDQLKSRVPVAQWRKLNHISLQLAHLATISLGEGLAHIKQLEEDVLTLNSAPRGIKHLLQHDLFKPIQSAHIPPSILDCLAQGVRALIAFDRGSCKTPLSEFSAAFIRRYGDAEIPLMDTLDPICGLDLPTWKSQAEYLLPNANAVAQTPALDHSSDGDDLEASRILFHQWESAMRQGSEEIALNESDVIRLSARRSLRLPESSFVIATVIAPPGETMPTRILIRRAGGPPGAKAIARFCVWDEDLTTEVKRYICDEEAINPAAIFAEILHSPGTRSSNVVIRPHLRNKQIPLLDVCTSAEDDQIPVSDLLVSVRGNKVILRSRRSGKQVIPRLTCAHNPSAPDGESVIYRFLASVQEQDCAFAGFAWPRAVEWASRLPRVVYKDCILSPQTWRISLDTPDDLQNSSAAHAKIEMWRNLYRWPRFVEFVNNDECLLIDLTNPLSIDSLAYEMRTKQHLVIREAFVDSEEGFVHDSRGAFSHELIIPILSTAKRPHLILNRHFVKEWNTKHIPGSHWLYLKVYSGTCALDEILATHIRPLVSDLLETNCISKWFFVRHADPEWHLRLRLFSDHHAWTKTGRGIQAAILQIISSGLSWRVAVDTYQPEFERYGGVDAMPLSEAIFHIDSEFALSLIWHRFQMKIDSAWAPLALAVDSLWRAAAFSRADRIRIYKQHLQRLNASVPRFESTEIEVDRLFRANRDNLEGGLGHNLTDRSAIDDVFIRREHLLKEIFIKLREHAILSFSLARPFDEIVRAHAHMSLNRLSVEPSPAIELVTYGLLYRFLAAQEARERQLGGKADHIPASNSIQAM